MTGFPEHPLFQEHRIDRSAGQESLDAPTLPGETETLEELEQLKEKEISPSPSSFWKAMMFLSLPSLVLLSLVLSWVVVGINGSPSLPHGIFLCLRDQAFEKGDLVLIEDHQTRYFKNLLYVKRLSAVAGEPIPDLSLKAYTKLGQPLSPLSMSIVPPGFAFVQGDHADSFDSRYEEFGLVREAHLKARCIGLGTESIGLGTRFKAGDESSKKTSQRMNLESELFGWGRPLP